MKKSDDDYRYMMDELQAMIEKEKAVFRDIKDGYNASAHLETDYHKKLEKRRMAFDHAFQSLFMKHGVTTGNIRSQLDSEWMNCKVEYKDPALLKVVKMFDPSFQILPIVPIIRLRDQWHRYLDKVILIAERIWKESNG